MVASRTLEAWILPDAMLRLTTEREFAAGDLGRLDLAGDEGAARAYDDPAFISASEGLDPTFGHRQFGGLGVALQLGPDPHTVWTSSGGHPASCDGQVRLATQETRDAEDYQAPAVPGSMRFLACWEDGFDGTYSGGGAGLGNDPDALQPPSFRPVWDSASPGMLNPDGVYVEKGRTPGYVSAGNMAPGRGTVSLWVKPNYDATLAPLLGRPRVYLNNTRTTAAGSMPPTACFFLANIRKIGNSGTVQGDCDPRGFGMHFENWHTPYGGTDTGREQACCTPGREVLPHRWYLLTALWDSAQATGSVGLRLLVDRGLAPEDRDKPWRYMPAIVTNPIDFTAQFDGPAVFHLGHRGPGLLDPTLSTPFAWSHPDATFDEFALYDFGPATGLLGDAVTRSETLAQARFKAGRYYKESDYAGLHASSGMNKAGRWLSAPIDLNGRVVRALAWTQVVPPGLRGPGGGATPEVSDPGPEGRILMELTDLSGKDYAVDAAGRPIDAAFDRTGGHPIRRAPAGAFRLHAIFQPNLSNPLDTAILDPLALDDVTVICGPMGGRKLLAWSEGS
jgi:hypothetical protein